MKKTTLCMALIIIMALAVSGCALWQESASKASEVAYQFNAASPMVKFIMAEDAFNLFMKPLKAANYDLMNVRERQAYEKKWIVADKVHEALTLYGDYANSGDEPGPNQYGFVTSKEIQKYLLKKLLTFMEAR